MAAFSVGALGMIGVPPFAGFISKIYLGMGALEVDQPWVVLVLAGSTLLNAAYFLPLLYRGWFNKPPAGGWKQDNFKGHRFETHWMLLVPALFTALLSILVGIFAGTILSPLGWSEFIISTEFAQ